MGSKNGIRSFFTGHLVRSFENNQIYHLKGNGDSLQAFDKVMLARTDKTIALFDCGKEFVIDLPVG